jgi:hypothetical protein
VTGRIHEHARRELCGHEPLLGRELRHAGVQPSLSARTQGNGRVTGHGASLIVKVAQKTGEANIRSVHLSLPKKLPARLTTLQKACAEATFAKNPALCPAASIVGTAVAHTPVRPVALEGPGYFVSHGERSSLN